MTKYKQLTTPCSHSTSAIAAELVLCCDILCSSHTTGIRNHKTAAMPLLGTKNKYVCANPGSTKTSEWRVATHPLTVNQHS